MPPQRSGWLRRALLNSVGAVALGLGTIGIVLPLLPTTPFVILASACFAVGNPRIHLWLRGHPRFGPALTAWEEQRAVQAKHKALAIVMIWLSIGASVLFLVEPVLLKALLLTIAASVTAWLLVLPTPGQRRRGRLPQEVLVGDEGHAAEPTTDPRDH